MVGKKIKVLFVCVHNSARSQMAEAYLKKIGSVDHFTVESAGLTPGKINPLVIKAMAEEGIDISENSVDSVFDFFKEGRLYHYVISVCEEGKQKCPIFPSVFQTLYWSFEDPSSVGGSEDERYETIKKIRDQVKNKVTEFVQLIKDNNYELPQKEQVLKL